MFVRTTAIDKILKLNKFIRAVKGGSSAGKTFGILPVIINTCTLEKNTEVSVVAESIPHLKRGAIRDFKKIMKATNRWNQNRWNATDFRYDFANGSFIEFFSADHDSKLRGARRDILYINEANNITFNAYTELAMRTKQAIYLDWNPVQAFWFDEEIKMQDNVDFITLTYEDNEAAPDSAVDFILRAKEKAKTSSYWANWFKVYGLGEIGSLQGVVFDNWTQKELPEDARLIGTGVDFGYTNDPTAIVDLYKWNDTYIFDERYYETKLSNEVIASRVKNTPVVVCDSAEPKSIARLQELGANATGSIKGKDSIRFGIELLQKQPFYITPRSVNLIREIRGYVWETDRDNNYLQTAKGVDHAIDAMRYVHTYCTYYTGNYVIG